MRIVMISVVFPAMLIASSLYRAAIASTWPTYAQSKEHELIRHSISGQSSRVDPYGPHL